MRRIIMAYYIFCEIAWMKKYRGVTENDKPKNGGKYIKENGYGGEVYNFLTYNHKCYGYVMHYGEMHIERFDKNLKNSPKVRDVTVIFVASDGLESKIVGWYENAAMFRDWQQIYIAGDCYDYNFIADEKNCYLIEENMRTFRVPRATTAGKERGMGRSQVWYAESAYAQNEFIPKVRKYLDSMKAYCTPFYLLKEKMSVKAKDKGQTADELIRASYYEKDFLKSLSYLNLAVAKDDCFETRKERAYHLMINFYLDEAEEDYKAALQFEDSLQAMAELMNVEYCLHNTTSAIGLGERIRRRKSGFDNWSDCAYLLAILYFENKEYNKAESLMYECESEEDSEKHNNWIPEMRKSVKEARKKA